MDKLKFSAYLAVALLMTAFMNSGVLADVNATINPINSATFGIIGGPIQSSQVFTCTATSANCEPSDGATITYQWSVDGTPVAGATGASYTYSSATPGSHAISCKASIKDTSVTPTVDCGSNSDHSIANVIGGPITGDTDLNYYCTAEPAVGHLSGIGGQPSGTTYSWSISGPATLSNGVNPVSIWTQLSATYIGTGESNPNHPNDVTAKLIYSLNGVSYPATLQATIHEPVAMNVLAAPRSNTAPTVLYYPDNPNGLSYNPWYGFDGQQISYQIVDQYGADMPSINVNEKWDNPRPSPGSNPDFSPNAIGGGADAYGVVVDQFLVHGYNTQPPLTFTSTSSPNSVSIATFRHRYWVGSVNNGNGCGPFHEHDNVEYRTNGVNGD